MHTLSPPQKPFLHRIGLVAATESRLGIRKRRINLGERGYVQQRQLSTSSKGDAGIAAGWQHPIYISTSTNPYFNLSLEDMLFRCHDHTKPLLLIYRDDPCVVIGRNQNPWKEVNLDASKATGIPFIRRRSGGGTVYHDHGNTNFSIHLPRVTFDRHVTAQIILRAVRSLGIDARVNDRNDICVGADKMRSAYKIVHKRAYHHGTMLISTQLDTLGDLLHVKAKESMITKGVASVRSPVCNLQRYNATVSHETFTNAVVKEFQKEYASHHEPLIISENEEVMTNEDILKGMAELPTWEWAFGQTPEFTYAIEKTFHWGRVTAEIRSKHGIILGCAINASSISNREPTVPHSLMELGEALIGQRYAFTEMNPRFDNKVGLSTVTDETKPLVNDVKQWLIESMS